MVWTSAKFARPRAFATVAILVFLACAGCDGPNTDADEEISCSQAEGGWLISKVLCDGRRLAAPKFAAVQFTSETHMDWVLGSADCQKKVTNVYHLQKDNLDVYGTSFFSCSSNGTDTQSCSGMQAACDNTVPGSLHSHQIPKCSINYGSLKLGRTATAGLNNQGLSFCNTGEYEEIYFTRQYPGSASLTFSTGYGYDFKEPILPQQLSAPVKVIMTNRGSTDATNISPQIQPPFEFVDAIYPGRDENGDLGTCSATLPALSACTFYIRFRPTEVGKVALNMPILYSNGTGMVTSYFKLSAEGEQPIALLTMLSERSPDFGTLVAKTSDRKIIRFKNVGTGPAFNLNFTELVPPFFYPVIDQFPGDLGNCGDFIGFGEECDVEIEFSPDGPGIFAHEIHFSYRNGIVSESGEQILDGDFIIMRGSAVTAGP